MFCILLLCGVIRSDYYFLLFFFFLHVQALSEALLQVRADLVETAQRTLEGEDERAAQEKSIRELVTSKTQQLQVKGRQHVGSILYDCLAGKQGH